MRTKSFVLVLQALVLSVLMSVSVSATPIIPGNVIHPLIVGVDYSGGNTFLPPLNSEGYKDTYHFRANTNVSLTATGVDFSGSFLGSFKSLIATWQDVTNSNNQIVVATVDFLANPSGFDLALPLIFGKKYDLVITAVMTAAGPGGRYKFDITAVPLPPAALLLLSGLIGIGALGRRRRGAKKVSV